MRLRRPGPPPAGSGAGPGKKEVYKIKRLAIGITGASGSILAKRLISCVALRQIDLNVVATPDGEKVFEYETGVGLDEFLKGLSPAGKIVRYANDNMFAAIASGSCPVDAMIILPCSMATAGKIANACGSGLLCRAADVCLKERTRLVVVPRETPLGTAHLKNLTALSEMGAVILPPMPMFYGSGDYDGIVDGIVGRVLKCAGIENELYMKWDGYDD